MDAMNTIEDVPQGPERGTPRETTASESWGLLRSGVVGRLAVVVDQAPDIFPVNFAVDHGTVVIRTAGGTKLEAARRGPVAFEVDGYDLDAREAWSVVLKGTAVEVHEVDEAIEVMGLPLSPWARGSKPHLLRVIPSSLTGRRFEVTGGARRA
jgi:nitroimidazol reductase NimA-like FMN-containing flavoprotein (pyridoxamine 5'-phosphate oxidase superfamily)